MEGASSSFFFPTRIMNWFNLIRWNHFVQIHGTTKLGRWGRNEKPNKKAMGVRLSLDLWYVLRVTIESGLRNQRQKCLLAGHRLAKILSQA